MAFTITDFIRDITDGEMLVHIYEDTYATGAMVQAQHSGLGFKWFFRITCLSYRVLPNSDYTHDWHYEFTRINVQDGTFYESKQITYTDRVMDMLVAVLEDTCEDTLPDVFYKQLNDFYPH